MEVNEITGTLEQPLDYLIRILQMYPIQDMDDAGSLISEIERVVLRMKGEEYINNLFGSSRLTSY